MTVRMLLHLQKAYCMQRRMASSGSGARSTGPSGSSRNPSTLVWQVASTSPDTEGSGTQYDVDLNLLHSPNTPEKDKKMINDSMLFVEHHDPFRRVV